MHQHQKLDIFLKFKWRLGLWCFNATFNNIQLYRGGYFKWKVWN